MSREDLLALSIIIALLSPVRTASASELLNCAEPPFKLSGVCDGKEYRQDSHALEDAMTSLKASPDADLSFLSLMAGRVIKLNLQLCLNPSAIVPPFETIAVCVTSNLRLASSYIKKSSGKKMLLGYFRKSRSLDIALVEKFPRQFLGITASYFGDLHLGKGEMDETLYGSFTDVDHKISFPARLINPSAGDISFFVDGPCKQLCASHWLGSFELIRNILTFQLSSKRNE